MTNHPILTIAILWIVGSIILGLVIGSAIHAVKGDEE